MLKDCWSYLVYRAEDIVLKKNYKNNHKRKQFVLQKAAVCIAAVLWLITAARVVWSEAGGEDYNRIISAFGGNIYTGVSANIQAQGAYGTVELTDSAKEIILEKAAEEIGINKYKIIDTKTDNGYTKELYQNSKNGTVSCKFITLEKTAQDKSIVQEQYLAISITLSDSIDGAFTYEEIVKNIMREMQIDCDVMVNLQGKLHGNYTKEQREELAKQLLKKTEAKEKVSKHLEDSYVVYAYDNRFETYYKIGADKVNVNICISYDEEQDITNVYYATPMNNTDY